MSGLISLVPAIGRMVESLKSLSWAVVKKVVVVERKRTWKEIRKELEEGKRIDERRIKNVEDLAKEIGWIDVVRMEWKLQLKKETWHHIHRDIVSTVR